jgi:hypothetical protein
MRLLDDPLDMGWYRRDEEKPHNCRWTLDIEDNLWSGDCGACWYFEFDGPVENGVRFCPGCGKPCCIIEPTQEES